jgi:hypothetical protein
VENWNEGKSSDLAPPDICLVMFRFVGCLPSTTDMSARHRRMRAGVVQTPMEETAECSGAA